MHTSWSNHKGAHVSNSAQDSLIVPGSIHCFKVMFSPLREKKKCSISTNYKKPHNCNNHRLGG